LNFRKQQKVGKEWIMPMHQELNSIIKGRNWKDESKWDELHSEMTDAMIRFERDISPNINEIETL